MARNWERREAISVGCRPAERRRSKPWGSSWGGCCCSAGECPSCCSWSSSLAGDDCGLGFVAGDGDMEEEASAARAAGESVWVVETEQWM